MGETTTAEIYTPDEIEAIRAQLRAVMDAEGLTIKDVARAADIKYTTLHAWLGDKYEGRNDRQAEAVKKWLEARVVMNKTRALVAPPPSFVMTKSAEDFFSAFQVAQYLPDMVMITGAPGVGKTMAADSYACQTPNVWKVTAQPCHSTVRMFLDALSFALGLGIVSSSERISRQIVHRLSGSGGLVIVDEVQHLPTPVLDQLRQFHDMAKIGLALVGNEHTVSRFDGFSRNAHHAQLSSRVGARVKRAKPLLKDIDILVDRWNVSGDAERKLLRAIGMKPGALRGLTKCLQMAMRLAAVQGASELTEANILMAWQQLGNDQSVAG